MNYEWQKCKGSDLGDSNKCTPCLNWLMHMELEPNCKCGNTQLKTGSIKEKLTTVIESSLAGENAINCSLCGKNCTRDYPAYHVADSIVGNSGVPNAPVCGSCIH